MSSILKCNNKTNRPSKIKASIDLITKKKVKAAISLDENNGKLEIKGDTGNEKGHAEMDALHILWVHICDRNYETFKNVEAKSILCTAKPCCVNCAAVLGLLDIRAAVGTRKTKDTMGISWAISYDVRELLAQATNCKANLFTEFCKLPKFS